MSIFRDVPIGVEFVYQGKILRKRTSRVAESEHGTVILMPNYFVKIVSKNLKFPK